MSKFMINDLSNSYIPKQFTVVLRYLSPDKTETYFSFIEDTLITQVKTF